MHRNVILAAAGLSLLGVTGRAQAQPDQWNRQVSALLEQAASIATSNGMRRTHTPYIGSLRESATATHTVQLNAGTRYQLVGVCDNDCSDFDMRLFDPQGRMVSEDVLTDDTPVLSVSPGRGGTYTVRAIMTSCSSEPCRYGIGVYGSGGGSSSSSQSSTGGGQDQWVAQVNRLLNEAARIATDNGLRRTHEPYIGSLRNGATSSHTLQLNAGTAYQLIGVCDNDCSDFDLRLFDPRGREVASDVLTDDTPVLSVTPRMGGTYTVRAIMTACSDQPCRYGIGVYGNRGGGQGRGLVDNGGNRGNQGGDQWTQQVVNLLNQAASTATSRGMRRTHSPYLGSLRTSATSNHTLTLNGGTSYSLIGVCDNDCSDLDLRLFDPNGREVASDLLTDDTPVVSWTPRRTGTYTVRAIMTACSSEPCRYGIGVYGR
jgi:hypothetical protein